MFLGEAAWRLANGLVVAAGVAKRCLYLQEGGHGKKANMTNKHRDDIGVCE